MIKLFLIAGLIANYAPKLRRTVLGRIKSQRKTPYLYLLEFALPALALVQLYWSKPEYVFTTYVGLIIFSAGITLGTIARLQLRENYLPAMAAGISGKIVAEGVYRFVRHPIYLGAVLSILGFELVVQPILALAALVAIPIYIRQIRKEEKILSEHHKEEWRKYIQDTPFKLLPFLY